MDRVPARRAARLFDGGHMNDDYSGQSEAKDAPETADALDLLADHRKPVWDLFAQFDRIKDGRDDKRKKELVETICREIAADTESAGRH
jgi:hypothetical protein